MFESSDNSNESPSAATKRGIRWDAGTIIASLVGLLALLVAGYTAYVQREQVQAQVWPYLIGAESSHRVGLVWFNKGVGPAIVRSVELTVGGRPLRSWGDVLHFLDVPDADFHQSTLDGYIVSPGEVIDWIHFDKVTDYQDFLSAWDHRHVSVVVCYCSTLGECWTTQMGPWSRRAVPSCPELPASKRFAE